MDSYSVSLLSCKAKMVDYAPSQIISNDVNVSPMVVQNGAGGDFIIPPAASSINEGNCVVQRQGHLAEFASIVVAGSCKVPLANRPMLLLSFAVLTYTLVLVFFSGVSHNWCNLR